MVNSLRLQKRLSASILKCGRRKIWLDPNEMNEIGMANTRTSVRKLIRDGFIIKKPQRIHSRFKARQRHIERRKGRHLGLGKRKGTANARCPTKLLWMKRMRAIRRLLRRYRTSHKIDRRMYHRFYLKAKGNSYKNRANLIEHIDSELQERKRQKVVIEQYKARREVALKRKAEKDAKRKKYIEDQIKLSEEAERMVLGQKGQTAGQETTKTGAARRSKKPKEEKPEAKEKKKAKAKQKQDKDKEDTQEETKPAKSAKPTKPAPKEDKKQKEEKKPKEDKQKEEKKPKDKKQEKADKQEKPQAKGQAATGGAKKKSGKKAKKK